MNELNQSATQAVPVIPDTICEIAKIIAADWQKVNYAAAPYLNAMFSLQTVNDTYGADSARSVIIYFLSNATAYRGNIARAVKAKLKAIVK